MSRLKTAQGTLRSILVDLRAAKSRLARLESTLPDPGHEEPAEAELREAIECVQADLIDDAVATLEKVARRDAAALRQEFFERQKLAARLRGGGT